MDGSMPRVSAARRPDSNERRSFLSGLPRPSTGAVGVAGVAGGAAAAAAALAYPVPVIGGLFAAILLVFVLRWPNIALVLLFALLPLHLLVQYTLVHFANIQPKPFTLWKDFLIGALLLRGAYIQFRKHGLRLPQSGRDRFLIVYVFAYAILFVSSDRTLQAGYGFAADVEGPVLLLAILALQPPRRYVTAAIVALAGVALIHAGFAVWEQQINAALPKFFGRDPRNICIFYSTCGNHSGYRSGALFLDPIVYAFFGTAVLPAAFFAAGRLSQRFRLLSLVIPTLVGAGVLVTFTRSAYLGAGVGLIVLILTAIVDRRIRLLVFGIFVVGAAGLAAFSAASGSERLLHSEDTGLHSQFLQGDLDLVVGKPLGYGLGTTDYLGFRFGNTVGQPTESVYGVRAVEGGVVALALYAISLMVLGVALVRAWRRAIFRGDAVARTVIACAMASLTGVAFAGLFLPVQDLVISVVVWGLGGLALTLGRQAEEPADAPQPRVSRPVWTPPTSV
jgi:hypothetical protein